MAALAALARPEPDLCGIDRLVGGLVGGLVGRSLRWTRHAIRPITSCARPCPFARQVDLKEPRYPLRVGGVNGELRGVLRVSAGREPGLPIPPPNDFANDGPTEFDKPNLLEPTHQTRGFRFFGRVKNGRRGPPPSQ